jgi:prepilin-type processing-associated H-X9-DG protein
MNSAVGSVWWSDNLHHGTATPGDALGEGWLTGAFSGNPAHQEPWRTYGKTSAFTAPGPSSTWVIADENPDTINDGSLAVCMGPEIVDYPANYHGGGAGLAFADGHSEIHKWVDAFLALVPTPNLIVPINEVGIAAPVPCLDLAWIQPYTSAAW